MATSQDMFDKLIALNPGADLEEIRNGVLDKGKTTIETLMRDAAQLAPQAAGALGLTYDQMGVSPRGQSMAGRIGTAAFQRQQAQAPMDLNRQLRDYYKTSYNDTIGRASERYGLEGETARQNYQLQKQREEDDWNRKMQEKQLAATYAGTSQNNSMLDWIKSQMGGDIPGGNGTFRGVGGNVGGVGGGKVGWGTNTPTNNNKTTVQLPNWLGGIMGGVRGLGDAFRGITGN